jgi:hypothetical protein
MSASPSSSDIPVEIPLPTDEDTKKLRTTDRRLLEELYEKNETPTGYASKIDGLRFSNKTIAAIADERYAKAEIEKIEAFLNTQGTLNIPVIDGFTVSINSTPRSVTIVAATEITSSTPNHGEMASMLYLRDHIQTARALMELNLRDSDQYEKEGRLGKVLLVSALHLMSTSSQLARFDDVIRRGQTASQEDWPHISLWFDDIEGVKPNGWRNIQDAFQMLAHLALDAIDRGFLDVTDLAESHKKFLGSVVPLLEAVTFPTYENSGSWEEVPAHRTSVMAVETALLHKIKTITEKNDSLSFLQEYYAATSPNPPMPTDRAFSETVDMLLDAGLQEIGRRLPDESAEYNPNSTKYREADAALTYVLMYGLPKLLEEKAIRIGKVAEPMSHLNIENLILKQLTTLDDPITSGMYRYKNDSYQRVNFHTGEVKFIVSAIKYKVQEDARRSGGNIDFDKKQALRNELTPKGRLAAWTHPLGQLSAWAAERSLEEDGVVADRYRALSTRFLNRTLSTITGENQWYAVLGNDNLYHVKQVPAFKLPECLITYQSDLEGEPLIVPSPHTPLNWSSVMLKQAIGLLRISTSE